jgi:hypothetical protein
VAIVPSPQLLSRFLSGLAPGLSYPATSGRHSQSCSLWVPTEHPAYTVLHAANERVSDAVGGLKWPGRLYSGKLFLQITTRAANDDRRLSS